MARVYFGNYEVSPREIISPKQAQEEPRFTFPPDPPYVYILLFQDVTASEILWLKVGDQELFPYRAPTEPGHDYEVAFYRIHPGRFGIMLNELREQFPDRVAPHLRKAYFGTAMDSITFSVQDQKRIFFEHPRTGERYRLIKRLGSGSSGDVYLVESMTSQNRVVLKIVRNPDRWKHARREIEILSHLPFHKNIIGFIDSFTNPSEIIIMLEAIEGAITLEKYLETPFIMDRNRESLITLVDIMGQIAEGVRFLHEYKIAHMDLKSENVIMKGTVPIIIDYDLSCIGDIDAPENLRCSGYPGSPLFTAPELLGKKIPMISIDGKMRPDPTRYFYTDIYSLGVVFYYMVTRREQPFEGTKFSEYKKNALTKKPTYFESGNHELDVLILLMLSKQPGDRPGIDDVINELGIIFKEL